MTNEEHWCASPCPPHKELIAKVERYKKALRIIAIGACPQESFGDCDKCNYTDDFFCKSEYMKDIAREALDNKE